LKMAAVRLLLLITLEIPARRMNLFFDAQDAIPSRFAHAQGGSAAHQCIGIKASAFDGLRERDRESIPLAAQSAAQVSQTRSGAADQDHRRRHNDHIPVEIHWFASESATASRNEVSPETRPASG
jgi:hypothetical protein